MLGLEKLGFPGGTPSVAVDISGVNNSFQVEVGIEFYPADPFRGVMEYGSMDDEVNGWFAWNPRFCFSSLVLARHFGGMSTSGAEKGCMIRGETRRGPVSPGPM